MDSNLSLPKLMLWPVIMKTNVQMSLLVTTNTAFWWRSMKSTQSTKTRLSLKTIKKNINKMDGNVSILLTMSLDAWMISTNRTRLSLLLFRFRLTLKSAILTVLLLLSLILFRSLKVNCPIWENIVLLVEELHPMWLRDSVVTIWMPLLLGMPLWMLEEIRMWLNSRLDLWWILDLTLTIRITIRLRDLCSTLSRWVIIMPMPILKYWMTFQWK